MFSSFFASAPSSTHAVGEATASSGMYWLACAIFLVSLALIVSETIHKTKVALAGAAAVLLLSVLSQHEAFHSMHLGIDYNVIFLLISMMIIVNILGRSGAFEWTAVKVAKMAGGRPYPIMAAFVVFTAVFSAALDNVTTVLLFAPVTLLIADELELDPVPFLIVEAIASNVGGTATLIGDPPNLIIASRSGLTFMDFVVTLAPPVLVMLVALLFVTRLLFGKMQVDDKRRQNIMEMNEAKLIKDPMLVKKSVGVLALTIVGFALHGALHFEPATIALGGAALLLVISKLDPHEILAEVEWPTIFFFIGLFIIVGGVVKVGMVSDLSQLLIRWTAPNQESMFATSMATLWASALLSAFLDNIPYVATMAPLVSDMATTVFPESQNALLHPVVLPVWWALALGSCLGGNGSPIGASANVVVLGIAERSGQKISFLRFMAYGMPIMFLTLVISTIFLYLRFYL